jgi:ABC-type sugar transport system ATPase subunit
MNLVPAEIMDGAGGAGRIAGFRPEHIEIANGHPGGIDFTARVEVVEYLGDEQLVHLTRKDTAIQAKLPVEEQVGAGQELKLTVPRGKLLLFDAQTEERVRD